MTKIEKQERERQEEEKKRIEMIRLQEEERLKKAPPIHPALDESLDDALARIERELITGALEQNNFNLTRVAERLKLTRHSLRYRMQRLDMNLADSTANELPVATDEKKSET